MSTSVIEKLVSPKGSLAGKALRCQGAIGPSGVCSVGQTNAFGLPSGSASSNKHMIQAWSINDIYNMWDAGGMPGSYVCVPDGNQIRITSGQVLSPQFYVMPGVSYTIQAGFRLSPNLDYSPSAQIMVGTSNFYYTRTGIDLPFFFNALTGESAYKSVWNVDPLDGSGKSKCVFDDKKMNTLVINVDPSSRSVKMGFVFNDEIVWAHIFAISTPAYFTDNNQDSCMFAMQGGGSDFLWIHGGFAVTAESPQTKLLTKYGPLNFAPCGTAIYVPPSLSFIIRQICVSSFEQSVCAFDSVLSTPYYANTPKDGYAYLWLNDNGTPGSGISTIFPSFGQTKYEYQKDVLIIPPLKQLYLDIASFGQATDGWIVFQYMHPGWDM